MVNSTRSRDDSFSVFSTLWKFAPAIITSAAALVLASFIIHRTWPQAGDWFFGRRETGGLIFVESPEVYTRQRLVNDRYQQDAWLRKKLEEIDTSALIVQTESSDFSGRIAIGAGTRVESDVDESGTAEETKPYALLQSGEIPFGPRFSLQASQRDRIRQRILENALDDRHDLSGNTVIGLKFDTAIIPGEKTNRTPIVVVKVRDNLVDRLRGRVSEVAPYYAFSFAFDPFRLVERDLSAKDGEIAETENSNQCENFDPESRSAVCDIEAVNKMNDYFDQWTSNLERRLNDELERQLANERARQLANEGERRSDSNGRSAGACERVQAEQMDPPICLNSNDETVNRELIGALSPRLLPEIAYLNDTIETELRIPPRQDHTAEFKEFLQWSAEPLCSSKDGEQPSDPSSMLRLFEDISREQKRTVPIALPGPLRTMYRVQFGLRPASDAQCGFQVEIRLLPRQLSTMILDDSSSPEVREALTSAGYAKIECYAPQCARQSEGLKESEGSVEIWVEDGGILQDRGAAKLFDGPTLQSLISATDVSKHDSDAEASEGDSDTGIAVGNGKCRSDSEAQLPQGTKLQLGKHTQLNQWLVVGDGALDSTTKAIEVANTWSEFRCVDGRVIQLRAGAFQFLKRMASVESYTYAAFPRGDVSGVVSEASSSSDIGIASPLGPASGGPIDTELSARSGSTAVQARPTIVNFATGDREAEFDFGWAIVKEGQMAPMLASQVVLVSVPAYSEEIILEVWRGFIDVDYRLDRGEVEGFAPPANFLASQTIREFIEKEEQGAIMRLRVPADYMALDGMIIGHDILSGPHIDNIGAAEKTCHPVYEGRDFSIEIAGDRLWRSTVVTVEGVKADRIEVMPDMGGILAVFEATVSPDSPDDQGNRRNALYRTFDSGNESTLTVWTSEGNDSGKVKLCNGSAPVNAPSPEGEQVESESTPDDPSTEAGNQETAGSAESSNAGSPD